MFKVSDFEGDGHGRRSISLRASLLWHFSPQFVDRTLGRRAIAMPLCYGVNRHPLSQAHSLSQARSLTPNACNIVGAIILNRILDSLLSTVL